MQLSFDEFTSHAQKISRLDSGYVAVDFETTGLSVYQGARAFILGFAYEDFKGCVWLSSQMYSILRDFFSNPKITFVAHNAKFELSFLREQFGIEVEKVWDTEVMARLEYNDHLSYSLQQCALRIGLSKHEPMLKWLAIKGNKGRYHEAPRELIEPYVEQDAFLSLELMRRQIREFRHRDTSSLIPAYPTVRIEKEVLKPLFNMESRGLLVDLDYCRRAREHEKRKMEKAVEDFEALTSVHFVDSRKTLEPIWQQHGLTFGRTDLGNASFTEDNLATCKDHPITQALLSYRKSKKRLSSYWENFLELQHERVIHPSINQNRATTGRMSISDPSCQNWPTDEDDPEYPIRRAFIARPGCKIVSMDYSQMELRKMADEAGDRRMIEAFLNGTDFHQQTADIAHVPRSLAKNGRFAKLYGAGVKKVADTLGIGFDLSQQICRAIDESSPQIADYSWGLIRYAERNKMGYSFLGRRFYFKKGFEFKYPNYRIQGGCGEVLKKAIIDIARFIKENGIPLDFMLIPIHDEILFNLAVESLWMLPHLKKLMIDAYQHDLLPMDVEISVGDNFYDVEEYAS